jgi:glutamine synthetase
MFGYSLTRPLLNQAYFDHIFDATRKFDVQVEGLHTETGPGVYEAALAYTDALSMADRSHLFKTSVKQIASLHGLTACFMAKPYPHLPGCSGHIHVSLKGIDGLNAFRDTDNKTQMGPVMAHALAGLLEALPSMMAILAPNINSYKRLVENYWAPITVSYGFENRIAAIRIISPPICDPSATRLEIRVPGADVRFNFPWLFSI